MNKVIRIGTVKEFRGSREVNANVFCKIVLTGNRLSITGVVGPLRNGDAIGSCGQIEMDMKAEDVTPAPGWTKELIAGFLQTWRAWHLNDMRSGSPAQRAELAKHEFPGYPMSYYDWAKEVLTAAGLQPDPAYLRDGKPYSYGSAWLQEDIPAHVVEFLESLPASDIEPAWV